MWNCGCLVACATLAVCAGCTWGDARVVHAAVSDADRDAVADEPNSRHFRFHYRFQVSGLLAGKTARVWLPVPQSNEYQDVFALVGRVPGEPSFHHDDTYGNRILYVEAVVPENGHLNIDVPYQIHRREVRALVSASDSKVLAIDGDERELFLKANSKVPVEGRPLELLTQLNLTDDGPFALANQLYELVDRHVTYNKDGTGWGNGDVLWVCDSKRGNCTDFHSLFISLARSQGIPARFEIGFPISSAPEGTVGGYHCWAWCHVGDRGWIPVDISEADKHPDLKEYYFGSLTPDRVTFSTGRDVKLVPNAAQESVNFFIYPHIEVEREAVPQAQITLQFSYADVSNDDEAKLEE